MKATQLKSALLSFALVAAGMGVAGCSSQDKGDAGETVEVVEVEESGSAQSAQSSSSESSQSESAASEDQAASVITIIDVRTPEEYAEGHLEGAINLDLNSGQFEEEIPTLDPEETYGIYCRSGNRSAQATALLLNAGFANVVDLGSMQDASEEVGLPVVE